MLVFFWLGQILPEFLFCTQVGAHGLPGVENPQGNFPLPIQRQQCRSVLVPFLQ